MDIFNIAYMDLCMIMANPSSIINEIIQDLESKDSQRINKGIQRIEELSTGTSEEQGKGSRRLTSTGDLLRRLLALTNDREWETRYAAIRGMKMIHTMTLSERDLTKIIPTLLRMITDKDGRVRWATVNTLDWFRIFMPEQFYIETYYKLKEKYYQETGGTQKSIGQALERMDSPHFRLMLRARELRRSGVSAEEVKKLIAHEGAIIALGGLTEEMRKSAFTKRMRMKSAPITPNTTLKEALNRYNKNALEGMAKTLEIPPPVAGLKKGVLIDKIISYLRDPEHLEGMVTGLAMEDGLALLDLLLKNGCMPWDEFAMKHGDDMEESIYWNWHPPRTTMGRLKLMGLLIEGTYKGESRVQVPHDLRFMLEDIKEELIKT